MADNDIPLQGLDPVESSSSQGFKSVWKKENYSQVNKKEAYKFTTFQFFESSFLEKKAIRELLASGMKRALF